MVKHLCDRYAVEIVEVEKEETDASEQAVMVQELIDFMTVLVNRNSSRRQAERRRKVLGPEALAFVQKELGSGRSMRHG